MPTKITTKPCKLCGRILNLESFHVCKDNKDGRHNKCKDCVREYKKEYYRANKDKINAHDIEFYEENSEKIVRRVTRWRKKNPQKVLEYQRNNRIIHHDEIKQKRINNKDHIQKQRREHRLLNHDRILAYDRSPARRKRQNELNRKRYKEDPSKARAAHHRRRARKLGAIVMGCNVTSKHIRSRCEMFGNKCWMCGGFADTIDHVIALEHGGKHIPANLRPACKSCNSRKGSKSWKLFARHKNDRRFLNSAI